MLLYYSNIIFNLKLICIGKLMFFLLCSCKMTIIMYIYYVLSYYSAIEHTTYIIQSFIHYVFYSFVRSLSFQSAQGTTEWRPGKIWRTFRGLNIVILKPTTSFSSSFFLSFFLYCFTVSFQSIFMSIKEVASDIKYTTLIHVFLKEILYWKLTGILGG